MSGSPVGDPAASPVTNFWCSCGFGRATYLSWTSGSASLMPDAAITFCQCSTVSQIQTSNSTGALAAGFGAAALAGVVAALCAAAGFVGSTTFAGSAGFAGAGVAV